MSNPLITAPQRAEVYLYPGDVEARLEQFDDDIEQAFDEESSDVRKRKATDKIAAERDKYLEQVRIDAPKVVLEPLTHRALQALYDEHPARKGNRLDEAVGYDRDTFPPALVRASIVAPEVTDEQWAEFAEQASAGRMARLQREADRINGGDVDLPKSSAVSTLARLREREQKRRRGTE